MRNLALLIGLAALSAVPQIAVAQIGCSTQVKPLRPVGIGSWDLQLFCQCNQAGGGCHWEWGFLNEGRRYSGGIDASIPLQVQPVPSPLDSMHQVEQIRLMQQQRRLLALQAELERQRLRAVQENGRPSQAYNPTGKYEPTVKEVYNPQTGKYEVWQICNPYTYTWEAIPTDATDRGKQFRRDAADSSSAVAAEELR